MEESLYTLHADIEESHWWFRGRRRIISSLINGILAGNPDSFIVDIGCGTGGNLAYLCKEYRGIGVDSSAHAIEAARAKYPDVTFVEGEVEAAVKELPQQPDVALLLDVLEHVEDDRDLFAKALSAVRPGGYLLITVPADMRLWSEHDVQFGHYRRYDIEQLRALWAESPVQERLCSYFNARLYYPIRFVRFLKRMLTRSKETKGHDFGPSLGPLDSLLEGLFAGEKKRLLAAMQQNSKSGYRRGVSLVAVLKRTEGS